ncbi:hypothetical protein [Amycolatopsis australiensis]|uniref:Uncharacterized protein n=1 Tax=Amycolatopsis australiensis TaxID=546364 RepID=A0A1K1T2Y0_9PSEU|nr:hypothetical protein [Amycolatopsis australiensis]SFW90695.1 hypothetical protein SAMN04489730_7659 [Amycolatopsis australiensis]
MTYHSTEPVRRPKSTGADVKTFVTAVLLTFGVGLLGMVGWAVLDSGFGGFLGLVGGVFGVVWWRHLHGKAFPKVVPTKSVVLLAVVNAVLALILLLTAG